MLKLAKKINEFRDELIKPVSYDGELAEQLSLFFKINYHSQVEDLSKYKI